MSIFYVIMNLIIIFASCSFLPAILHPAFFKKSSYHQKCKCVRYKKVSVKKVGGWMCICCRYTKFTHSSVKDRTTKTCEVREKRFLVRVFRKGRKIRSTCLILQYSYTHMWEIELAVNKKGQMLFCMKKKSMKKLSFCRGYLHYHNCQLHDYFLTLYLYI